MALFRALSTTKGRRGGYDKLLDETNNNDPKEANQNGNHQQNNAMLKRAISVPARVLFGSSNRKMSKFHSETNSPALFEYSKSTNDQHHQGKQEKKKGGKVHPVFGLFDGRSWRKKKLTANPDFSRYIEYLKEGGVWNKDTDSPAIHYK